MILHKSESTCTVETSDKTHIYLLTPTLYDGDNMPYESNNAQQFRV